MANRTERYGIRGAQCAPKLHTGRAGDDSWHGRRRTGADLQGVGGELPPVAPRHGVRPLQQRRRRSRKGRKDAGGPRISGARAALRFRREIPSPRPRRETLAHPHGRRGAWPVSGEGRSRGLEHWRRGRTGRPGGERGGRAREGDVVKTPSEGLPRWAATALDSSCSWPVRLFGLQRIFFLTFTHFSFLFANYYWYYSLQKTFD